MFDSYALLAAMISPVPALGRNRYLPVVLVQLELTGHEASSARGSMGAPNRIQQGAHGKQRHTAVDTPRRIL